MNEIENLFYNSKLRSMKHEKYFHVYEKLFFKYKNQKIKFVEVGVADGGSLEIWKRYFGLNSNIIGVDINPLCKKFENKSLDIHVEIGDQSSNDFWERFFEKYGEVDVILDDGGHTNQQQIITCINTVPKIKNGGLLLVEDTHTSYINYFNSSQKYSFVNFSKLFIDDINSKFHKSFPKKNFSLNKYVFSLQYFESFVAFFIDRNLCGYNKPVFNSGVSDNVDEIYTLQNKNKLIENKFYSVRSLFKKIKDIKINSLIKKYFK